MRSYQGADPGRSLERARGDFVRQDWRPEELVQGRVAVRSREGERWRRSYHLLVRRGSTAYTLCRRVSPWELNQFAVWSPRLGGKLLCPWCIEAKRRMY